MKNPAVSDQQLIFPASGDGCVGPDVECHESTVSPKSTPVLLRFTCFLGEFAPFGKPFSRILSGIISWRNRKEELIDLVAPSMLTVTTLTSITHSRLPHSRLAPLLILGSFHWSKLDSHYIWVWASGYHALLWLWLLHLSIYH